MKKEIEIKFKMDKPSIIRKKLKNQGAKFIGKTFERTLRFDTPTNNLYKNGKFLRIRTGFKNVITFKRKLRSKSFKEREEIELEISDPKKMEIILENLGFTRKRIMEKYREKWELENAEISIDKLPMGNFVEIEGSKKEIQKTTKILGLNFQDRIIKTYWDLWRDYCKRQGVKEENIIFRKL